MTEAKSSRFGGRSARLHLSLIRRLGYQGTRSWRGRCLNQHDALGRDRRGSIWCLGPRSAFEEVGRPRSAIANGLSKIVRGTKIFRFFRAGGHDRLPPLERAMTSTTAIYPSISFWRACAPSLVPPSPPRVDSGSSDPRAAWAGSWTAAAAARAPRGLRRQPREASALVATSTRTVQPAASKATTSR